MTRALLAITVLLALTPPAAAEEPAVPEIVFPVVGDVFYSDTFGAPRDGGARTHEGTDIMTYDVKGLPVVAAASGTVSWVDDDCCHLAIDHGDGWSTWYIHLDNDTPGTDDGQGWGIAPGITEGVTVSQGQLIGWVGDSGNAEDAGAQLHFEIRQNDQALNPYPHLVAAPVLDEPGEVARTDGDYFIDDDASVHEADIDRMFELRLTRGCNPPENDRYCPNSEVTRGQLAAFLRRFLQLSSSNQNFFADDDTSQFADDIDALTEAGIGFGCSAGAFCPDQPLLRSEMAEFLVRTFAFEQQGRFDNGDGTDWFVDDDGDAFEPSINRLKAAGVTVGCNPPDNTMYCPDQTLTRAQMASFIIRAISD